MLTRPEAEAIYEAGKETVVRQLLTTEARIFPGATGPRPDHTP